MKPIIILDAFITDKNDEERLSSFIDSIKCFGNDILLMSNTTIPQYIQDKVNYFFYDKRNQLFDETKFTDYEIVSYWTKYDEFKVNDYFFHTQKHALSVLINLFRGVMFSKNLGYTHFYKMEYDAVLGKNTKMIINSIPDYCENNNKKGVFYVDKHIDSYSVAAHYFYSEVNYFLENFYNVLSEEDYINYLQSNFGNQKFLIMERFVFENLNSIEHSMYETRENFFDTFNDTTWNTKHTRLYYDKKYGQCICKVYNLIKNDQVMDNLGLYCRNIKTENDYRKIIVQYNDGTDETFNYEFKGFGHWTLQYLKYNVKKIMVYDDNGLLYEESLDKIIDVIEVN
jgi:hypothetical protein